VIGAMPPDCCCRTPPKRALFFFPWILGVGLLTDRSDVGNRSSDEPAASNATFQPWFDGVANGVARWSGCCDDDEKEMDEREKKKVNNRRLFLLIVAQEMTAGRRLQDPDAHQSRLQGIHTRAAEIAIR
jgi:hypothetical protein